MLPYLEKNGAGGRGGWIFEAVIKLKILKCDHLALSRWAIHPMKSVLMRDRTEDRNIEVGPCEDRGRDWIYAATRQRMSGVRRNWGRQGSVLS